MRSKFDSNPDVAGSYQAQCMQYCFLLNTAKNKNLIGKKLQLGTSIIIRQIPLIAQLVERRTVV